MHREFVEKRIAELKSQDRPTAAWSNAPFAACSMPARRAARSMSALLRHCAGSARTEGARLTLAQFKATVREQFFLLLLEPEATLAAIPKLLPADMGERRKALAAIRSVLSARGEISGETAERLKKVASLFGVDEAKALGRRKHPFRCEPGPGQGVVTADGTIGSKVNERSSDRAAATPHAKYDRLIASAKQVPAAITLVVYPCDEASLRGVCEAAEAGIIKPVLVGPAAKIKAVAAQHNFDISQFEIVDAPIAKKPRHRPFN